MFLLIEALHLLIALLGILPRRVVFIFEEEGAIAGIFRVDIQLAGDNRPAHHRRGAELDFINRFTPWLSSTCWIILPSSAPSVSIFEPTFTGSAACSGKLIRAASASAPDHVVAIFIPHPSVLLRFAYRSLREKRSPFASDAKKRPINRPLKRDVGLKSDALQQLKLALLHPGGVHADKDMNLPGSATYFICWFQNFSASTSIGKLTVCVSPGLRLTF